MLNINNSNQIKVQTNVLPAELSATEINETVRGISLSYQDGKFITQSFFTPPILGEINQVYGLKTDADVHFKKIRLIGPNLFHIHLTGKEDQVDRMCHDDNFYNLLKAICGTFTGEVSSRRYIETANVKDCWDIITSLDKKRSYLANRVLLNNDRARIGNILILGDRLLGLTGKGQAVWGKLTPDLLEKENVTLEMTPLEHVNKQGRIDLLEPVPNSEDCYLVTVRNIIYQFNLLGDMVHFKTLDENVKRVNTISFNHTRTIAATTEGLYEFDVQEMPNMVRATSLPRQISNPTLKDNFKEASYVEDPYVLGIHPAIGIFAKNEKQEVLFF